MNRDLSGDTSEDYQLRVLVTDGATPGRTNSTVVKIRVNRNICAPEFQGTASYTFTVPETQTLGINSAILNPGWLYVHLFT